LNGFYALSFHGDDDVIVHVGHGAVAARGDVFHHDKFFREAVFQQQRHEIPGEQHALVLIKVNPAGHLVTFFGRRNLFGGGASARINNGIVEVGKFIEAKSVEFGAIDLDLERCVLGVWSRERRRHQAVDTGEAGAKDEQEKKSAAGPGERVHGEVWGGIFPSVQIVGTIGQAVPLIRRTSAESCELRSKRLT